MVSSSILRRPLLVGVDGHWVEQQRRRQAAAAYRCATVLADGWLRLGDRTLTALVVESAIAPDPLREVGAVIAASASPAAGRCIRRRERGRIPW